MIRAVCWTCALLALVSARTYERCELARDLLDMGVDRDHVSTWVCIAYHESRFDTAAQNPHSGDHGLFQISELYWCGPGKACGLPCSELRDDDISDDLQCALQVHEEHTRLQGNGFLAWVVYPQHCKHNTKKYIVDCDKQPKNTSQRAMSRSRPSNNRISNSTSSSRHLHIDDLKPPYLAINSIFRPDYGKVFRDKSAPVNRLNYKIYNIDDLRLPVLNEKPKLTTQAPITTATWRRNYVESKQFRKRIFLDEDYSGLEKGLDSGKSSSSSLNDVTPSAAKYSPFTTTTSKPFVFTFTRKPVTACANTETKKPAIISTYKPTPTTEAPRSTFSRYSASPTSFTTTATITKRPTTIVTTKKPEVAVFTTRLFTNSFENKPDKYAARFTSTTYKPITIATTKYNTRFNFTFKPLSRTTSKPHVDVTSSTYTTTTPASYTRQGTFLKIADKSLPPLTTNKPPIPPPIKATSSYQTKKTQSIFDLYLNPTSEPKFQSYKFPDFNAFKVRIFSGGTTPPPKSFTGPH